MRQVVVLLFFVASSCAMSIFDKPYQLYELDEPIEGEYKLEKRGTSTQKVNIAECVQVHNMYRERHGAPPVTWDKGLAHDAQQYALKLAREDKFQHDMSIIGKQGENLAMSWSSGSQKYTCKDATKQWYDEVKDYSFSNPHFGSNTGHFTEVVWKGVKHIGVGIAKNGPKTYVVARYSPPGNFMGQFAQNVGRPV